MTAEGERARQRDVVRRGYDAISCAYRTDDGSSNRTSYETTTTYSDWIVEFAEVAKPGGRVLDLGCGAGVPAARDLVSRGYQVTGVDISRVQITRARDLVPDATFVQADMAIWDAAPASFDAAISLYALIHVPLEDQHSLIPRLRRWLVDGGYLLAIVGAQRWTGTESYLGADMFWDHADTDTYLDWFTAAGLIPQWHRHIPEGDSGHTLLMARAE